MDTRRRFTVTYIVLAMLALLTAQSFFKARVVEEVPYSEFKQLLGEQKVKDVVVFSDEIRGTFVKPQAGKSQFVTRRVPSDVAKVLDQYHVRYSRGRESDFLPAVLSWVLPVALLIGVWMVVMRRMAQSTSSGLMTIGKSKAKVYMEKETGVTFADVAGVDEAKAELQEVVAFLRNPREYGRLGARMPKGVLLVGPPGTGKTLLARAVAGEAGVPFFSISGSAFVELFVGVGAARVRDLFEQARQRAPCIIFIDELDALGRARHAAPLLGGGHDEKEQTLNQLLVELDGLDPTSGIVLIAASNRPEILDPALLRAGRFDRQVLVDRPDRNGRVAILRVHSKGVRLEDGVELEQVAAMTPGFTGADLANLVNEAALVATRRKAESVSLADFTAAIERIVAGLEKRNRLLNPAERRIVAYHEMGHALVANAIPGSDPVHKISVIPRGISALGYTIQRPTDDRYLMTRRELENKMTVLLGGRAAESLVFEQISTGAADDLAKVTEIARSMAAQFGMMPALGNVSYEPGGNGYVNPGLVDPRPRYSDVTAHEIDEAVRQAIEQAYERARDVLIRNREVLEAGAAQLLDREVLDESHLKVLFAAVQRRAEAPLAAFSNRSRGSS
jgi:cell division protease FtsH